jgi:Bacterial membrane protein YfhO
MLLDHGLRSVFETISVYVYQNPNVLPRAFTIDWEHEPENQAVFLPPDVRLKMKPANIPVYRNTEVRLEGDVDKESLLVLTDNWHEDWTAYVNGVETPIQHVDGTFRGVQVPKGHYEVHMVYQPDTLKAAILCTSAILILIIYLLLDRHKIDRWLSNRVWKQHE